MINGKTVLGVIPARGGSKGVPRKNIRVVAGKPLLAYSIEAAQGSAYIDRFVVSTEDAEIREVALAWGAEVLNRPPELAQDETPGIDPVLHAIATFPRYDYVVLLQPTSPLRTADDIDSALEQCGSRKAHVCVTICQVEQSPYRCFELGHDGRLKRLLSTPSGTRRQDLPQLYAINGAVYIAETDWLRREKCFVTDATVAHLMSEQNSLDIDTEQDLLYFEFVINKLNIKNCQ